MSCLPLDFSQLTCKQINTSCWMKMQPATSLLDWTYGTYVVPEHVTNVHEGL